MNIKPALVLSLIIIIAASCSDQEMEKGKGKGKEEQIPNNAFPIIYRGRLYVEGFADSIKGNYIFDTGASNLYYDSTYYSENSFHYLNFFPAFLPGVGTTPQKVQVIQDTVSFTFGKYLYRTKNVPVLQLKPITGDFADGILGMEYFYNTVMEINYEKEYMRLFQSIDSVDVSTYSRIELTKKGNRLFVPLKIGINDTLAIAGDYALDFGSGGSVHIASSAARKNKLIESIEDKMPFYVKYGGVGGETSGYDFMAKSLQIGDFVFNNVTMNFSIDKSGALASYSHLGLLGNDIYEKFSVIIDFLNNDLYLKPNSKFEEPFEFSRLGFKYVDRNQTMNAWIVTGLYSGCSAEKHGLEIDDRIVAVNGISIDQISYESQRGLFEELSDIALTIKRDDIVKEIKFDLESNQ